MITKVGLNLEKNYRLLTNNKKRDNKTSNPINNDINWGYYLPFTGEKKNKSASKIESIMFNADPAFRRTTEQLEKETAEYFLREADPERRTRPSSH